MFHLLVIGLAFLRTLWREALRNAHWSLPLVYYFSVGHTYIGACFMKSKIRPFM